MTTSTMWIAVAAIAIAGAARADDPSAMKNKAVFTNAKDLKWMPAMPDLPKGMAMAVLYGDPSKPGMYAVRLEMPDGYKIPPHWHSQDEQLTVLEGTFVLHMGDTMKSEPHELDVGGYHFLPAKMHHGAEAKGGTTIVQVQGMGPFDIHYVNPADNPNPKAASK